MTQFIDTLLFLDFEASSLSADSWPIEIGFGWLAGDSAHQDARLIRPAPAWPMSAWSMESECIHKIPHAALLDQGLPAWDVATWALAQMAGRTVVSDAPEFEARWLLRLLEQHPDPLPKGLRIHDYDAVLARVLQPAGLDAAWEFNARHKRPHRAGEDAKLMAQSLLHGLQVDRGERPLRP